MSSEQEFSEDLVCFFDSGSLQGPAFYSPLFPSRAVQYEVFECFHLLTASHTDIPLSLSANSSLLDLSCLFSLSTTLLTLDFRCNPPLSFLFWIFYISLRSSSSPVLLSILLPLPLLSFLWFLLLSFLLFLVLLFVPNSCIFWWFSTIHFSYISYCLPVFFLALHYFQFLSFLGRNDEKNNLVHKGLKKMKISKLH